MKQVFDVVYSAEAKQDLFAIYRYLVDVKLAPDTAKNLVRHIRGAIHSLQDMPERFVIVDWEPWQSLELHRMPVDNYVVFYLVDKKLKLVTVVRTFYGGRNISEIM